MFSLSLSSYGWAVDASEKTAASTTSFGSLLGQMLFALAFIVGLLLLAAWLIKRSGMVQGRFNGQLAVLASVSVGQREKVVLIRVGQTQLLVGVTTSEIRLLHQLEEPIVIDSISEQKPITETFAQKLNQVLNKSQGSESV